MLIFFEGTTTDCHHTSHLPVAAHWLIWAPYILDTIHSLKPGKIPLCTQSLKSHKNPAPWQSNVCSFFEMVLFVWKWRNDWPTNLQTGILILWEQCYFVARKKWNRGVNHRSLCWLIPLLRSVWTVITDCVVHWLNSHIIVQMLFSTRHCTVLPFSSY